MNLPKIWDGQRWEKTVRNIFVRPESLGFLAFRFRGSMREFFSGNSHPNGVVSCRGGLAVTSLELAGDSVCVERSADFQSAVSRVSNPQTLRAFCGA